MATDEEIDRFVTDNKELIDRIMAIQREGVELAKILGKDTVKAGMESTSIAAKAVRKKGGKYFTATYEILTDSEIQKHFITSGLEFVAGFIALTEASPLPDCVKDAVTGFEKNMRAAACRANRNCPAKAKKIDIAATAAEKTAE